ncbi:hypothetical protein C8Q76DRAFT_694549 [Earliella scabrosa]|nr:hypothetical protein C8Q76DRAFT_694549 [Earliella scabrosa]
MSARSPSTSTSANAVTPSLLTLLANTIPVANTRNSEYIANITLGTREIPVLLDTGSHFSSDLWVTGAVLGAKDLEKAVSLSYAVGRAAGVVLPHESDHGDMPVLVFVVAAAIRPKSVRSITLHISGQLILIGISASRLVVEVFRVMLLSLAMLRASGASLNAHGSREKLVVPLTRLVGRLRLVVGRFDMRDVEEVVAAKRSYFGAAPAVGPARAGTAWRCRRISQEFGSFQPQ